MNDSSGKPLGNATVLVYSAGVRTGYSIYCPTCYVDCGKRTVTDADGHFSIPGLDDELVFNLLVIKDGFSPVWIRPADPLKGPLASVAMTARAPVEDPVRVVRGRVVEDGGTPVPFALVEQDGATVQMNGQWTTAYGQVPGGDTLAVANENGEFELAHGAPVKRFLLRVSARAKAPALISMGPGLERQTVVLADGATVHGRLLKNGKPQPNVELAIMVVQHISGTVFPEERVSTDAKGRFAFTSVPAGRVWDLYAKRESLEGRDALSPIQFATMRDGEDVDVGDIRLQRGVTLSGRVELSDGRPAPVGNRVLVQSSLGSDTQTVSIGENGSFSVSGLIPGAYLIGPSVRGYRPHLGLFDEVLVKHDVVNYVVKMEPDPAAGQ